jgi:uncharacterized protein
MEKLLLPLLLTHASSGRVRGRTRFQKLIFLYQTERDDPLAKFRYFPWDYGPYSKELQEYIDALVEFDLLEERAVNFEPGSKKIVYEYVLTAEGNQMVESFFDIDPKYNRAVRDLRDLAAMRSEQSLNDLLKDVYANHPDFAVRSKLQL